MGRVGGITCPFIVSRDTSLRAIGLRMFSVSIATSVFVKYIPETFGKALGNIDASCREDVTGRPSFQVPPKQHRPVSAVDNNLEMSSDIRFHEEGITNERGDERIVI